MLYLFDTFDGEVWDHDTTGAESLDLEAAREMAQSALADMVRDALPNGPHMDIAVRIRNGEEIVGLVKLVVDEN